MGVSYLEIYNEEVRDLLGKDRERSLEVNVYPGRKQGEFVVQTFRSKNDQMLAFTQMVSLLIHATQRQKWKH